jgi:succinyl-CoA synthetase beta subunit
VKAQIHAGGRGKGKFKELGPDAKGGVRLAKTLDEVKPRHRHARQHAGDDPDRWPAGKQVNRLYITDGADIAKEFYLALLVDRASGRVAMVASTEGGMDIEEVAHSPPRRSTPSPSIPRPASCRIMAARRRSRKLSGDLAKQAAKVRSSSMTHFSHRREPDRDQPARS